MKFWLLFITLFFGVQYLMYLIPADVIGMLGFGLCVLVVGLLFRAFWRA